MKFPRSLATVALALASAAVGPVAGSVPGLVGAREILHTVLTGGSAAGLVAVLLPLVKVASVAAAASLPSTPAVSLGAYAAVQLFELLRRLNHSKPGPLGADRIPGPSAAVSHREAAVALPLEPPNPVASAFLSAPSPMGHPPG